MATDSPVILLYEEKKICERKVSIEAGKVNLVWQGFLKIQVRNELNSSY